MTLWFGAIIEKSATNAATMIAAHAHAAIRNAPPPRALTSLSSLSLSALSALPLTFLLSPLASFLFAPVISTPTLYQNDHFMQDFRQAPLTYARKG